MDLAPLIVMIFVAGIGVGSIATLWLMVAPMKTIDAKMTRLIDYVVRVKKP